MFWRLRVTSAARVSFACGVAAANIYRLRDCLEVRGVAADTVPAEVVYLKAVRYRRPGRGFVGDAMRAQLLDPRSILRVREWITPQGWIRTRSVSNGNREPSECADLGLIDG